MLLAFLVLALQDSKPARDWQLLDGVAAQAGDDIITHSEMAASAQRLLRASGANEDEMTDKDHGELYGVTIYRELMARYEAQGGENLGVTPADVDRLVRLEQREQRLSHGAGGFAELLRKEESDASEWETDRRRFYYRRAWRDDVLGRRGFGAERPRRETFVRPGRLFAIYRSEEENLGQREQVQFRQIVVPVKEPGKADGERALLLQLAEDCREGREEFETWAGRMNPTDVADKGGLTEVIEAGSFRQETMRAFSLEAELDEISEPFPIVANLPGSTEPQIVGYRLLQLVQRVEAQAAPAYSDPATQQRLRKRIEEKDDQRLLQRGQARLYDRSFRWLDPSIPAPIPPATR